MSSRHPIYARWYSYWHDAPSYTVRGMFIGPDFHWWYVPLGLWCILGVAAGAGFFPPLVFTLTTLAILFVPATIKWLWTGFTN